MAGPADKEATRERPRPWRRREAFLFVAALLASFFFLIFETRLPPFSSSQTFSESVVFFLLINLNIVLILLVVFLLGRNIFKLVVERRQRVLGSHLRTRLVVGFVVVAIVPAVLLFITAYGFMRSSIESWFSVQVEGALEGSLEVAETFQQESMSVVLREARELSRRLGRRSEPLADEAKLLAEKRREYDAATIRLLDAEGTLVAEASAPGLVASFRGTLPTSFVEQGLDRDETTAVVRIAGAEVLRAAVRIPGPEGPRGLIVVDRIGPRNVARRAAEIEQSYRQYKQLKLLRRPLINNYVLTLLLASLVVVFGGTWLGFAIARSITGPIQRLAEGTRRVAAGHFEERIETESSSDEVATLVDAFNQMTANLRTTHTDLADRRRALETILANITGGVVSIDRQARIETVNEAARHMLGIGTDAIGMPFRQWFASPRFAAVRELLSELDKRAQQGVWDKLPPQRLTIEQPEGSTQILATGVVLKNEEGEAIGALLFFEDVTELLKVQRMEAWREVARRIAHEIKNPLTPIQLSAQRLRKRYSEELTGSVFDECTRTIIAEVEVLKNLVSEFSRFARLPSAPHVPTDLNDVVEDALVLIREGHPRVEFRFAAEEPLPRLDLDRDGIRRVLTNLLDNAVAALPEAPPEPGDEDGERRASGHIEISTCHDRQRGVVRLEVADDGAGMTPEVKTRLFEPYFSTKPNGTGLGLAIVSGILADHQAFIRVHDNRPRGTRFVIELPVRERATVVAPTAPVLAADAEPAARRQGVS
jgi:two-component system, NtrC family, nitrogen regulation sensor histidine kinase NtrY